MLVLSETNPGLFPSPFSIHRWLPDVALVGKEKIPRLEPVSNLPPVDQLVAFDKQTTSNPRHNVLIHFYRDDEKLQRVVNNPRRYIDKIRFTSGAICPDFSLYREMPRHQRVWSVFQSRAVGALFQSHGLSVLPTMRWADESDYDFCFSGVERGSVVAISTHGCVRTNEDKIYFRNGLYRLLDVIQPSDVLVHGAMPDKIFYALTERTCFHHFPSDIELAHSTSGASNGRR